MISNESTRCHTNGILLALCYYINSIISSKFVISWKQGNDGSYTFAVDFPCQKHNGASKCCTRLLRLPTNSSILYLLKNKSNNRKQFDKLIVFRS